MATSLGAKSRADSKRTLPAAGDGPRVVVVGLGGDQPNTEDLRRAAGAGVRHATSLADNSGLKVAVSLGTTAAEQLSAVAEGALLGSYQYEPISAEPAKNGKIEAITVVHAGDAKDDAVISTSKTVVQAVLTAREWVNLPANLLYPESFSDQVRNLVRGSKIAIDVLDETALSREGYGGLMAVGGGSSSPPRLVRLSYSPRGAKFHLALVGKGITFDSGGLNLKPGEGMYTMKCDMAGAAAVLVATHAIAELGLKIKVTTYGALAENMPSGSAYRHQTC
jgi:leucyl aminopeptidase